LERLRHLARAGRLDHAVLVQESASALDPLAGDRTALLLSCRRLLQRHPTSGPLWWLCARTTCASDPRAEAWRCVEELDGDPTPERMADELAEGATVVVLGWPEVAADALARRGDLRVLAVDAAGEGAGLVRALGALDIGATVVGEGRGAAAVLASDAVVLEASALGPERFIAVAGSRAAAAVARHAGINVVVVAGAGRVLPSGLWAGVEASVAGGEPWRGGEEVVPLDLVDAMVRPGGRRWLADLVAVVPDCPDVPELR
jgi:hypothetical protein